MTTEEVNEQYKPIDQLIDSIPESSATASNGEEYARADFSIKAGLMMVVHHCKNMKFRGVNFPAPFTKEKLVELVNPPYTPKKLNDVHDLVMEYRRLDDESLQEGGGVA